MIVMATIRMSVKAEALSDPVRPSPERLARNRNSRIKKSRVAALHTLACELTAFGMVTYEPPILAIAATIFESLA